MFERKEERRAQPIIEEAISIKVGTEEDLKIVNLCSSLCSQECESLADLLKEFKDIFAWSYENMPGIHPDTVGIPKQRHTHIGLSMDRI